MGEPLADELELDYPPRSFTGGIDYFAAKGVQATAVSSENPTSTIKNFVGTYLC
jgi:hypothetical protein